MAGNYKHARDAAAFLSSAGPGRKTSHLSPREALFTQGDPADSIFYLRKGNARVTVVSQTGKEATIMLLFAGDFVGEEALAATAGIRSCTATAITTCDVLQIDRDEMIRAMHAEESLQKQFVDYLLRRSMRIQADLVDHLFNSSEKRLARILLLMADFDKHGEPERSIPKISQETLAEMVGTTRSRVSFFMNRFRRLGLIEYNGSIRVRKSLFTVILQNHLPQTGPSL